jgi:hypothetical protein
MPMTPPPGGTRESEFLRDVLDLGAGLALLLPEYADRLMNAMMRAEAEVHDAEELIHVQALALARLAVRGGAEQWMNERWGNASRVFHSQFCNDAPCVARRPHD